MAAFFLVLIPLAFLVPNRYKFDNPGQQQTLKEKGNLVSPWIFLTSIFSFILGLVPFGPTQNVWATTQGLAARSFLSI
ncbi:hypothetical protein A9Q81_10545 [Gammaproteobacteria bacterium 42_54_T18]|nr:hypothetical protein A9Q81_10545 [Gammaproteobacteria bacterium 42_54_T18]